MHWSCQTWRFQYDYVELEHYANGIIKLVDPNSKFLTSLSDENNFQKTKIKSLEEEIKTFKIKILIWEKTSCPYLKWVKLSKVTTKQKQQTLPTNTRPRKTMSLTQVILIGRRKTERINRYSLWNQQQIRSIPNGKYRWLHNAQINKYNIC